MYVRSDGFTERFQMFYMIVMMQHEGSVNIWVLTMEMAATVIQFTLPHTLNKTLDWETESSSKRPLKPCLSVCVCCVEVWRGNISLCSLFFLLFIAIEMEWDVFALLCCFGLISPCALLSHTSNKEFMKAVAGVQPGHKDWFGCLASCCFVNVLFEVFVRCKRSLELKLKRSNVQGILISNVSSCELFCWFCSAWRENCERKVSRKFI